MWGHPRQAARRAPLDVALSAIQLATAAAATPARPNRLLVQIVPLVLAIGHAVAFLSPRAARPWLTYGRNLVVVCNALVCDSLGTPAWLAAVAPALVGGVGMAGMTRGHSPSTFTSWARRPLVGAWAVAHGVV